MVGMATLDERDTEVIEKLERAGLYDSEADDAQDRLALLRFNIEEGLTVDELVEAAQLGRLEYVAGDAYIRPAGQPMTVEEVAARADVPVDDVLRMWRSAGLVEPVSELAARHQIQAAILRLFSDPTTRESVTKSLAVGFADLVGFTAWTAKSDTHALAALVEEFEVRARDTVSGHGGRVVKMIGDEVMFVIGDAASACDVAAGLVAWNGDYYGPVVNLASRLVSTAEPNSVLVDEAVRSGAGEQRFHEGGRRRLKGFDAAVQTYVLTGVPTAP